jgi:peptidoglycan L-alanyl-D-glutamate endopeptidase CwlK
MASRALTSLDEAVRVRAERVLAICEAAGIDLLIYGTLRPLEEQAVLYRQSRSRASILRKIEDLHGRGFGFLADIIEGVGSQTGPHVTNAAPGESLHNYGLAFDAVPVTGGKCCWKYGPHKHLWEGYGEAVRLAGLEWAGDWTSFREYPHAQQGRGGNPLRRHGPDRIRELLSEGGML